VIAVGWYVYASLQSATPLAAINSTNGDTTGTTTGGGTGRNCEDTTTVVRARLSTSLGVIDVELYQNAAPKTVTNIVNLARSGFYDNLVWHRIVQGFVIQTGDPNTRNGGGDRALWGTGGSSQTVPLETCTSLHNNTGYLGMARSSDPNSGSSQFYINLANNNSLDGSYTVFGRVTSGMDVAFAIANVSVNSQNQPIDPVFLTSVTIY
jgi:cyclophilin family peptidyl-prolyl cis-trans isomerase